MKRFARTTLAALIAVPMALASEPISVEVNGTGENREKAVANALERALPKALGSEVFYVRHRSAKHEGVFSTAISQGLVESYDVVHESEIQDGVRVRVRANIAPEGMDEPIFQKVERWRDVAVDAARISDLQKRMSRYRSLLAEFLGSDQQQLSKGYAIVPRGYEITNLSQSEIKGRVLVDIIVNESWWDTYYDLLDAMQPITVERIVEGPVGFEDVDYRHNAQPIIGLARHIVVDESLKQDLASPLALTLRMPGNLYNEVNARDFVLHKNSLYVGASVTWEDHRHESQPGKRAFFDGGVFRKNYFNDTTGQPFIDTERSELSCHSYKKSKTDQIFCGSLFVVGVPFSAANSNELDEMLKQGVTIELRDENSQP